MNRAWIEQLKEEGKLLTDPATNVTTYMGIASLGTWLHRATTASANESISDVMRVINARPRNDVHWDTDLLKTVVRAIKVTRLRRNAFSRPMEIGFVRRAHNPALFAQSFRLTLTNSDLLYRLLHPKLNSESLVDSEQTQVSNTSDNDEPAAKVLSLTRLFPVNP